MCQWEQEAAEREGSDHCDQTPGTAICGQQLQQRTMEPDERPFQCESCSKRYLRKNNLEDHVLMEHPDTEQVRSGITVPDYAMTVS